MLIPTKFPLSLYLGSSKQTLTDGDNVLDVKTGDRLYFSANTGYVLKSVMNGLLPKPSAR